MPSPLAKLLWIIDLGSESDTCNCCVESWLSNRSTICHLVNPLNLLFFSVCVISLTPPPASQWSIASSVSTIGRIKQPLPVRCEGGFYGSAALKPIASCSSLCQQGGLNQFMDCARILLLQIQLLVDSSNIVILGRLWNLRERKEEQEKLARPSPRQNKILPSLCPIWNLHRMVQVTSLKIQFNFFTF